MLRHGANRFFQSVRVRLRFSSTQIIRFSSGSLYAILKNTVRFRLRFDKNSLKPVYKTPVGVRFDSLFSAMSFYEQDARNFACSSIKLRGLETKLANFARTINLPRRAFLPVWVASNLATWS